MAKSSQIKTKLSGKSKTIISDFIVSQFLGTNTYIKDIAKLQDGESPSSLNWLTSRYSDNIQLRRGYALLGTNRNLGNGVITGLGVGTMNNGTQVPFFTYGQKILYYDTTTNTTNEVTVTNIRPSASADDYMSIMPYQNITGSYVYITSPNSSIYKMVCANPSVATNLLSTAFRGIANIQQNRMALWQNKDTYGNRYVGMLFLSQSDLAANGISQFTQTTGEVEGTGNGTNTVFSGTLLFKSANSVETCFNTQFAAPIQNSGQSITGISEYSGNESYCLVNVANPTAFSIGNAVLINGVVGMTQINNLIGIVENVTGNGVVLSIDVASFSSYESGGTLYLAEYFDDDTNGNLSSSQGGTGTINYANGAFTLNFANAPISGQSIIGQYYVENALNGGVVDFDIDGAVEGEGKQFMQGTGGGDIQGVFSFDQTQYCFHNLKTWYLTLTSNDTNAQNLPYRSDVGIPFFKAAYPTDDGIVYLDNTNPSIPKVQTLEIDESAATSVISVVPAPLSDQLDLSQFGFSTCVIFRFGDYDLVSVQGSINGEVQAQNVFTWIRNRFTGSWDLTDYASSSFDRYNGTLISGDSLSNNVYTLLSGFDDDTNLINNYWYSKQYNFGIEGLKKFKIFHIRGLIQFDQKVNINLSFDGSTFVTIFTILGTGQYVSSGAPQEVGTVTVGQAVVGGGDVVTAYPFEIDIPWASPLFEYVQVEFQAINIGFIQIDEFGFKDVRYKGRHILPANTIAE